jgi:hypothetical protein
MPRKLDGFWILQRAPQPGAKCRGSEARSLKGTSLRNSNYRFLFISQGEVAAHITRRRKT